MIDRVDVLRLVDLADELQIKPSIDTLEYSMLVHIGKYNRVNVKMREHKYIVRTESYNAFWQFKIVEFDYCHECADYIRNFIEERK